MTQPSAARGSQARSSGPRRRRRQRAPQAFTLTELMIVVSVVTLLVAVILPAYQRVRDSALIGTQVSELLDFAKACVQINSAGVGERPAPPPVTAERGGVEITQGCTRENQGATLLASWGTARASGIRCYASRSLITSSKAQVTVSINSELSCLFQD